MNINSKLCNFISNNSDWRDKLKNEYDILIKEIGNLAIFNYGIKCDFANELVQESRGIIIDTYKLEVVCWPFRKFGNYGESYADTIDWKSAKVQDKIDGSIIKLWYNQYKSKWQFSTNSMIFAEESLANSMTAESFNDIILKSDNYNQIKLDDLNTDYTYIFELVSPETQVVIKYPNAHLYHIGTRNNITGQELCIDIGIDKPKEYNISNLDECIEFVKTFNKSNDGTVNSVQQEGVVVVDGNYNRIKVKSADYLMLHHIVNNNNFSKQRIVDLIRTKTMDVAKMSEEFPNFAHYFKYYDYKIAEFDYQLKVFLDLTKRIYEEFSYDRKAVALVIKNHRFAPLGFVYLNNLQSGVDEFPIIDDNKYAKFIPDYKPEKLSDFFFFFFLQ